MTSEVMAANAGGRAEAVRSRPPERAANLHEYEQMKSDPWAENLQEIRDIMVGFDDLDEEAQKTTMARKRELFEPIVRSTYADTYTLAKRLVRNEDEAHDVAQEAYLRAFKSSHNFKGQAIFSTWMYRITANTAMTYKNRQGKHRHAELNEEILSEAEDSAVHKQFEYINENLAGGRYAVLREAVASLPDKLRQVVVLRDMYNLSHVEISEELGISETTAKVRYHRARKKLKAILSEDLAQHVTVVPLRSTEDSIEKRAVS